MGAENPGNLGCCHCLLIIWPINYLCHRNKSIPRKQRNWRVERCLGCFILSALPSMRRSLVRVSKLLFLISFNEDQPLWVILWMDIANCISTHLVPPNYSIEKLWSQLFCKLRTHIL